MSYLALVRIPAFGGLGDPATRRDLAAIIQQARAVASMAATLPASIVMPAAQTVAVWDANAKLRGGVIKAIYSFVSLSEYDRDREWNDAWLEVRDRYQAELKANLGRYGANVAYLRSSGANSGAMIDAGFAAAIAKDTRATVAVLEQMAKFKTVIDMFQGDTGRNWVDDVGDGVKEASSGVKELGVALLRLAGGIGRGAASLANLAAFVTRNFVVLAAVGGGAWLLLRDKRKPYPWASWGRGRKRAA